MEKIIIGVVAVVFMFNLYTPAYAQSVVGTSSTSTAPVVQADLDALREQLIGLLLQLIEKLQAQLDAEVAKNTTQDAEIEEVKTSIRSSSGGSSSVTAQAEVEEVVDYEAEAREKVGAVSASISVDREEGEAYLSVVNYLDIDTLNINSNDAALEVERSCGTGIANNPHKVCAHYATYTATSTDLIINISFNGVERTLIADIDSNLVRASW